MIWILWNIQWILRQNVTNDQAEIPPPVSVSLPVTESECPDFSEFTAVAEAVSKEFEKAMG